MHCQCEVCGKEFKSSAGLGGHRKAVHNLVAPCGTLAAYQRHIRNKEATDIECRAVWNRHMRTARSRKGK